MNDTLTAPRAKYAFSAASLPEHPLFHGMGERDRQILAECSMQATFEPGAMVVETGEPANCFYLVIHGRIGLETPGNHSPLRVQTIGTGDVLGWSWLFPPYYFHFSARAAEPTVVVFFYGTSLRKHCEDDHDLGYELVKRIAKVVVKRLDATRRQLVER